MIEPAAIRFYLNGSLRAVRPARPTISVLDWLRLEARLSGTKEGCGEGDCGACAIVVCDLDDAGALRVRAINSCLVFLPALDGAYALTVEGLADADGRLHPVQDGLATQHASQCGYCTPGFVMALAAFGATPEPAEDEIIHDALAGNLCRCTGYRPIADAARQSKAAAQRWWEARAPAIVAALRAIRRDEALSLAESSENYFAPVSAAALCRLLDRFPEARIVAGATDLGLTVGKQRDALPIAVSVARVSGLRGIEVGKDAIRIGGAATLTDLLPVLAAHYPGFGTLLRRFGSRQIRNLATIGGNLATASPIGDLAPALLALDAAIGLRSARGRRALPLAAFFTGYRRSALERGEFIETISVPLLAAADHLGIYKLSKRYDQDISTVCAAIRIRVEDGRIAAARVALGGMAATPKRAAACERALEGREFAADSFERALPAIAQDFAPLSDLRGGARYRQNAAANLMRRFWLETGPKRSLTEVMAL